MYISYPYVLGTNLLTHVVTINVNTQKIYDTYFMIDSSHSSFERKKSVMQCQLPTIQYDLICPAKIFTPVSSYDGAICGQNSLKIQKCKCRNIK